MRDFITRVVIRHLTGFASIDDACLSCDLGFPTICLKGCEEHS